MRRLAILVKLSLRNVFRNVHRSLFVLAMVGTGAMGLLLFAGFNRGLMNQYRANTIRARWGHGQLYTRGYRGIAMARPWEKWIEASGPLMEKLSGHPTVKDLFPRVTVPAMLVAGSRAVAGQGEGIDGVAESRFFDQLNYVQGGNFQSEASAIVMGVGLAEGLGVNAGDKLQLVVRDVQGLERQAQVTVSGIFHTGSNEFDTRAFRIPIGLAQNLLGTDRVESISVALSETEDWTTFARAAERERPDLEAVPFDELDKIYYRHAVDWLQTQFGFVRSIILLVVFLAVFNLISMTVVERTPEIAMLRANGDSTLDIALGQILETVALGVMGGVVGLLAGWGLVLSAMRTGIAMPPAPGITRSFRILLELDANDGVQILLLCTVTAVLSCLPAVWRVMRTPITEALNHP